MPSDDRRTYRIYGLVQGVGFRPYVAQIADELGLSGYVRNDGGIVTVSVNATSDAAEEFLRRILLCNLSGARIDRIEEAENTGEPPKKGFYISYSTRSNDRLRLLPPDAATCAECERELYDPSNRRYRHPFISCVSCGPRYTILEDIPYDRENTVMRDFPLCDDCEQEYSKRGDRREYAQTVCCHKCGPRISGKISAATEVLRDGGIVAVKDIGGYHLACDALNERAVSRLRDFKSRDGKPFAVMFRDTDGIRQYADVSETENSLLNGSPRPIVLLHAASDKKSLPREVLGDSNRIGAMLPCNPIQMLMLDGIEPLVMTSGNRGGEPICTDDEKMRSYLGKGIDFILSHERRILSGLDDSIYQVISTGDTEIVQVLRRARGLVPMPIAMKRTLKSDTFAAGGDLKAVFALGRDNYAYLSGHFGDLTDIDAQEKRRDEIRRMGGLLCITPEVFISDIHPAYETVKNKDRDIKAANEGDFPHKEAVFQHHHAHIASVMAEHGLAGRVLGIAFDGTGYGSDKSVWGGEFLLCEGGGFKRVGHLREVTLIGSDESARNAKQTEKLYNIASGEKSREDDESLKILRAALKSNIGTYKTTSAGRLFDAVASLLGIADYNSYEGECAMRLQAAAEAAEHDGREDPISFVARDENGMYILDGVGIFSYLQEKMQKENASAEILAYEFHRILADSCVTICERIFEDEKEKLPVALSGGTMQNALLLRLLIKGFKERGHEVYVNEQVPPGDGGLALGQLYLATFL